MSEHTPGPWHLRLEPFADGTPYAIIDAGADIHPIVGGAYNEETQQGFHICGIFGEADARLIAAAPKLLDALKHARGAVASLEVDALGGHDAATPDDESYHAYPVNAHKH